MAIVELGNSGGEHRTVETYTATAHYHMLWSDYINGYGYYYSGDNANVNGTAGTNTGKVYLPYEGMPYGYNTDLTVTDIYAKTLTPGSTFNGMDRITDVVYTWSNTSRYKDSPRANSASSWRMFWNGNLEYSDTDAYVDLVARDSNPDDPDIYIVDWVDKWMTHKYGTSWTYLAGETETDRTAQTKFLQRHGSEVPFLEMRYPRIFFNFTFYTDKIKDFSPFQGYINNTDFITAIYNRREAALQYQLKLRSYSTVEKIAGLQKYMLVDIQHNEMSSSLHEYNLVFEEKLGGWNHYDAFNNVPAAAPVGGIDTGRYPQVDFYTLVTGADSIKTKAKY